MKHYTTTIPLDLAEKVKAAGMPMGPWQGWATPFLSVMEDSGYDWLDKEFGLEPSKVERRYAIPSYGEVFDWLMEKGIHFRIESDWNIETQIVTELATSFNIEKVGMRPVYVDIQGWHKAANKAIEKALELIK